LSTDIEPEVGFIFPVISLKRVLFPAPF